ncbi:MAG: hypothetical protein LBQ27_00550 [Clostridiales bacterium]|jgi:predicted secreted protein|nr:hypothetical protein [Clostridiales bacterium]
MYTGLLGKINIGGNDIAYISNWSIEDTADIIEVSKLGEKYKEKLVGQQTWSASADGAVDFTTASGQAALFAAKHSGSKLTCKFYLYSNGSTNVLFQGDGYIESLGVDLSAEDKGNISISINGTGALTAPSSHSAIA